jgi:hypothetical protein
MIIVSKYSGKKSSLVDSDPIVFRSFQMGVLSRKNLSGLVKSNYFHIGKNQSSQGFIGG